MSTPSFSLVNNATGEKIDLPAVSGTLGPVGLDVGKVYGKAGVFYLRPWLFVDLFDAVVDHLYRRR